MRGTSTRKFALAAVSLIALTTLAGCHSSGYGKGSSAEKFNSVSYMQGYADAENVANDETRQLYFSTQGGSCSFMASEWSNSGEIDNFSTAEYIKGCEKRYTELGWTKNSGTPQLDTSAICPGGFDADGNCPSNNSDSSGGGSNNTDASNDGNDSESESAQPAPPQWKMTAADKTAISELISAFVQADATYSCPRGTVITLNSSNDSCQFTYLDSDGNQVTESTWTDMTESLEGLHIEWNGGYNVYYEFPGGPLSW